MTSYSNIKKGKIQYLSDKINGYTNLSTMRTPADACEVDIKMKTAG